MERIGESIMDGTALIFCEGALGTSQARTANNLLRFSERYEIVGVLDSTHAGSAANEVVEGARGGVPVFASLEEAVLRLGETPKRLVIGLSPDDGKLPPPCRAVIIEAINRGMGVDSALRHFLHPCWQCSIAPSFGASDARRHTITCANIRARSSASEQSAWRWSAQVSRRVERT
jgi:uncharacterized NAD-dependent epimerase/dehydratase family protein